MELNCKFENKYFAPNTAVYTCIISDGVINEREHVIKAIKGDHIEGKTHGDVKCVRFNSTCINYFPRGLDRHFPNLNHLNISHSDIEEVSRRDLDGLEKLIRLDLMRCQLTTLPDDLFTEMPKLRIVSLRANKIEFASSELLKPLLGRNAFVDLRENKSIDACFWPGERGTLNLFDDLMTLIDEKCMKPAQPIAVDSEDVTQQIAQPIDPELMDFIPKIKELWQTGKFSDLTVMARDKEFKVHKNILAIRSEVFAKIFEDPLDEDEMKINEFSTKSVEALLNFIYTNEILEDINAKEKFEIAVKFKVVSMKSKYEKIICNQLDDSKAWEFFIFAHRFSAQQIKEKAFRLIAARIPDDLPDTLMEDPDNLKKLMDYRRAYEEIIENSRNELNLLKNKLGV